MDKYRALKIKNRYRFARRISSENWAFKIVIATLVSFGHCFDLIGMWLIMKLVTDFKQVYLIAAFQTNNPSLHRYAKGECTFSKQCALFCLTVPFSLGFVTGCYKDVFDKKNERKSKILLCNVNVMWFVQNVGAMKLFLNKLQIFRMFTIFSFNCKNRKWWQEWHS